jgi:hypothetical protein
MQLGASYEGRNKQHKEKVRRPLPEKKHGKKADGKDLGVGSTAGETRRRAQGIGCVAGSDRARTSRLPARLSA